MTPRIAGVHVYTLWPESRARPTCVIVNRHVSAAR